MAAQARGEDVLRSIVFGVSQDIAARLEGEAGPFDRGDRARLIHAMSFCVERIGARVFRMVDHAEDAAGFERGLE